MAYTGPFIARQLGPAWAGYEDLAEVCEAAGLSNRQAQIVLLACRGLPPVPSRLVLGIPRQEYWRSWHRASHRLLAAFPRLEELLEQARDECSRMRCDIWDCYHHRTLSDHGPMMAQDENGVLRTVTLRARLVTIEDLGLDRVGAIDVLGDLLQELREARRAALPAHAGKES